MFSRTNVQDELHPEGTLDCVYYCHLVAGTKFSAPNTGNKETVPGFQLSSTPYLHYVTRLRSRAVLTQAMVL